MFPSERMRKVGLWSSGRKSISLISCVFGVTGACFFVGALSSAYTELTSPDAGPYAVFAVIGLLSACLYIAVGLLAVPALYKKLENGKNVYPIDMNNRLTKEELFDDIGTICEPYTAERNNDWLDVTWKWIDGYFADLDLRSPEIHKRKEKVVMMFRINDDYTYDMLDAVITESGYAKKTGIGIGQNAEVGRVSVKKFFGAVGVDADSRMAGANAYCLDTEELRRYMRRWFAERGYREN